MLGRKIIGIVGGVGPFAGVDLQQKILASTEASADQEFLPALIISDPEQIADRTAFLRGKTAVNPAAALAAQLQLLDKMGATVAGIPCNTAHAPQIFDEMLDICHRNNLSLRCLHMINEVGQTLKAGFPEVHRVGVLSTIGTYEAGFYPRILAEMGFTAVLPERPLLDNTIHPAIYDPEYGIKACGRDALQAREDLLLAVSILVEQGAEAVILGCTELPLVFPEKELDGVPLIDPTAILARALIREIDPSKLRPF